MSGSGSLYNATNFVSQHRDIVMVSINYRLGPLGFLNNKQFHDEDDDLKSYGGMNGIYDQIVALKWTKQFISDFGGDPDQITIFGESAGGLSVCTLLVSPLAEGLFNRAIIESGSCIGPWSVDRSFVEFDRREHEMAHFLCPLIVCKGALRLNRWALLKETAL